MSWSLLKDFSAGQRILPRSAYVHAQPAVYVCHEYPDLLKDPKNGTPPNMNPLLHWENSGII